MQSIIALLAPIPIKADIATLVSTLLNDIIEFDFDETVGSLVQCAPNL